MSITIVTSMQTPEASAVAGDLALSFYRGLLPTFTIKGNAFFQFEDSESEDVIFFPIQRDRLAECYPWPPGRSTDSR